MKELLKYKVFRILIGIVLMAIASRMLGFDFQTAVLTIYATCGALIL